MNADLPPVPDVDALSLVVDTKREIADDIWLFDLVSIDDDELPPFEPGAHIIVRTPAGVPRQYSLCSSSAELHRYQIGVKCERSGRGGSASMAEDLNIGDVVSASLPLNHFPLEPADGETLLIAGGIGVTPILAMARHLQQHGRSFRVIYCARSPETAAFIDVLAAPQFSDHTMIHYDGGDPEKALDIAAALRDCPPETHLYCCGPRGLMGAVREATRHWAPGHVHFEDFGGSVEPNAEDFAFRVHLARSGGVLDVGSQETILEAMRRHGLGVPSSCEAGACGACRTGLLAGKADHRDYVLTDSEHDSAIMVCVSRAASAELTIDA